MKNHKSPILFIVFNRIETTKKVFAEIKKYKPEKLYLASDGPRFGNLSELQSVLEVRDFLNSNIDWDCEVKTKFSKENLGCKYGPQSAISWFFENEEYGIILEDDCLPSESFFPYCEELLDKYADDTRVYGISGVNFHSQIPLEDSYYFSSFFFTWGWATWKDRWENHLKIIDSFYEYALHKDIDSIISNKYVRSSLLNNAIMSYEDELDAWDYIWHFSCAVNNGLIAHPSKNLIQNIGFGENATHTQGELQNQRKNEDLNIPLIHPLLFKPNSYLDDLMYKKVMQWMSPIDKLRDFGYLNAYKNVLLKRVGI
jgi:hypothetical protein